MGTMSMYGQFIMGKTLTFGVRYEYEIHHWEKYHSGEDAREEDLTHPEDIEHFRKHDEEDARHEEWEKAQREAKQGVVERNIPAKFRVN